MSQGQEPDHIHKYIGETNDIFPTPQLNTFFCYQDNCYSKEGPSINKRMYPPRKIGPKLYIRKQQ